MILGIYHEGGETRLAGVEQSFYVDDDLHVTFVDSREKRIYRAAEKGEKPTIAITCNDAYTYHDIEGRSRDVEFE